MKLLASYIDCERQIVCDLNAIICGSHAAMNKCQIYDFNG